ncbi:MAG: autotransporter domain-containing protein [Alphaproteobacteria bacterium]
MKLSKTGIVALSKQYRSVLKKCFLINAGIFMFAAPAMAADTQFIDTNETIEQLTGTYEKYTTPQAFYGQGGAISNSGTINNVEATFSNNSAVSSTNIGMGGAIFNNNKIEEINLSTFSNNDSILAGGAITNTANGNIDKISNSKFNKNKSITGGAIYNAGTISLIEKVTLSSNAAINEGGAIYSTNGLDVADSNFSTNSANYGGSISVYGDSANISGSTFNGNFTNTTSNEEYSEGGAIYSEADELTITDSTFENNKALTNDGWGGAISSYNNTAISNSTFINNSANNAGALSLADNASIKGSKFTGNSATNQGGAIFSYGATLSISDTLFESNTSKKIGGAIMNDGNLTLTDVTFDGNSAKYGGAIYNEDESSLTLKGTTTLATATDTIYNASDAKINVSSGANLINNSIISNNGTFTFENGSSYEFAYDSGYVDGTMTLNGNVNLSTIIANGTADGSYKFAEDINGDGTWTLAKNNLYNLSLNNTSNEVSIKLKSSDDIATSTGATNNAASAVSAVISGSATTSNDAFNAVATSINNGLQSSDASVRAAALKTVEQMSSDTTSSAQSSTVASASATFGTVGTRLSGGSVASSTSGMNSGDSYLEGGAVWAQTMINTASLSGSNGFDSDSNGVAFGAEKQINDNVKAGIGYAYSNTDIDTSSRTTDADTNTFFVYGEYKPSNWYVNGIASYSFASYDESSNTKTSSYDVDSFGLQAMTGYDMTVKNVDVTPEAGLRYVKVSQDSYTDTLDSKISGDDSDILTAVVGAKAGKTFALENGSTLRPEVKAALTYDLFNDDANSIVTLVNGSSYTTNGEALDKFGMEFGVGFTADVNEQVELSLGYEGKFRSDYEDHTGTLNVKYKF